MGWRDKENVLVLQNPFQDLGEIVNINALKKYVQRNLSDLLTGIYTCTLGDEKVLIQLWNLDAPYPEFSMSFRYQDKIYYLFLNNDYEWTERFIRNDGNLAFFLGDFNNVEDLKAYVSENYLDMPTGFYSCTLGTEKILIQLSNTINGDAGVIGLSFNLERTLYYLYSSPLWSWVVYTFDVGMITTSGSGDQYLNDQGAYTRVKANSSFPTAFVINGTTAEFCKSILDYGAQRGMSYLGSISCSDMPFTGTANVKVDIIINNTRNKGLTLELINMTEAPYRWYGIYHNSFAGWTTMVTGDDLNSKLDCDAFVTNAEIDIILDE